MADAAISVRGRRCAGMAAKNRQSFSVAGNAGLPYFLFHLRRPACRDRPPRQMDHRIHRHGGCQISPDPTSHPPAPPPPPSRAPSPAASANTPCPPAASLRQSRLLPTSPLAPVTATCNGSSTAIPPLYLPASPDARLPPCYTYVLFVPESYMRYLVTGGASAFLALSWSKNSSARDHRHRGPALEGL